MATTNETKLLPCAHCGGNGVIYPGVNRVAAQCEQCGIATYLLPTEQEAAAAWNSRALPPEAVQRVVDAARNYCGAMVGHFRLLRFYAQLADALEALDAAAPAQGAATEKEAKQV